MFNPHFKRLTVQQDLVLIWKTVLYTTIVLSGLFVALVVSVVLVLLNIPHPL